MSMPWRVPSRSRTSRRPPRRPLLRPPRPRPDASVKGARPLAPGTVRYVTEYRASFDAAVTFSNGGDLSVHGFRVDVPSADIDEAGIAALFVASLGLLMTDAVELRNVEVFPEPHKGTRGGPADRGPSVPDPGQGGRLVELSHVIRPGMVTYPGLPGPALVP